MIRVWVDDFHNAQDQQNFATSTLHPRLASLDQGSFSGQVSAVPWFTFFDPTQHYLGLNRHNLFPGLDYKPNWDLYSDISTSHLRAKQ